jgi:hypothetical protein
MPNLSNFLIRFAIGVLSLLALTLVNKTFQLPLWWCAASGLALGITIGRFVIGGRDV